MSPREEGTTGLVVSSSLRLGRERTGENPSDVPALMIRKSLHISAGLPKISRHLAHLRQVANGQSCDDEASEHERSQIVRLHGEV